MEKVPVQQLEYPGDGLHYKSGVPFTGIAVTYDTKGGWVQAEEEYKEGLVCGIVKTWHSSEALASEEACRWGVRHGHYREWSESGTLIAEGYYQYGIRVSEKRWGDDGVLTEDFLLKEDDPDFRTMNLAKKAYGDEV